MTICPSPAAPMPPMASKVLARLPVRCVGTPRNMAAMTSLDICCRPSSSHHSGLGIFLHACEFST
eukprot:scaffold80428_cov75-Phaeocystis_antarctica.AAC.1